MRGGLFDNPLSSPAPDHANQSASTPLATCATLIPLLILGACGGGDSSTPAQDDRYAASLSAGAQAALLPAEDHPAPGTDFSAASAAGLTAGLSTAAPTPPADAVQL